ncbi:hypothetical protein RvY_15306 [Ramazzottius varieornatus]|uniref:Uncharacterized protein n=1 Tax=Ramazzottius varieornatus TaxID=947166 RepID=A0A1D1VUH0_RAMVA|nr:hypothetical protein RvY_15306 [Ramazzottius varieornatus]
MKKARERLEKLTPDPKAGTKGQMTRVGGSDGSSGRGGSQDEGTRGPKNKMQKRSSKRITDIEQSDDE